MNVRLNMKVLVGRGMQQRPLHIRWRPFPTDEDKAGLDLNVQFSCASQEVDILPVSVKQSNRIKLSFKETWQTNRLVYSELSGITYTGKLPLLIDQVKKMFIQMMSHFHLKTNMNVFQECKTNLSYVISHEWSLKNSSDWIDLFAYQRNRNVSLPLLFVLNKHLLKTDQQSYLIEFTLELVKVGSLEQIGEIFVWDRHEKHGLPVSTPLADLKIESQAAFKLFEPQHKFYLN